MNSMIANEKEVPGYVDLRLDPDLSIAMEAMLERGNAYKAECQRLGRKFLPRQVARRAWLKAGLADGRMIRSRQDDCLRLSF